MFPWLSSLSVPPAAVRICQFSLLFKERGRECMSAQQLVEAACHSLRCILGRRSDPEFGVRMGEVKGSLSSVQLKDVVSYLQILE